MYSKKQRLNLRFAYPLFRQTAKKFRQPGLTILFLPKASSTPQRAVIVPKKLARHTPHKNQLRRLLFNGLKFHEKDFQNIDILLMLHEILPPQTISQYLQNFSSYVASKAYSQNP
jgi:ribonuclease P protein component